MITYWALLVGTGAALVAFGLHVWWWRTARPRDDVRALSLCFLVLPLAVFLCARWPEALAAYCTAACWGVAYILSYPGAQAASPSMLVVLAVARAGSAGLPSEQLWPAVGGEGLLADTLHRLTDERFAEVNAEGRLVPAPRGHGLLRVLSAWRAWLNLPDGDG
jgi:hypothetical protein